MLSKLLSNFLYNLVHLTIIVLFAVQNLHRRIWASLYYKSVDQITKSDIKLLLERVQNNKKLIHLVVIADTDRNSLRDFARLLIWSLVAGIPFLSFYDLTGTLEKQEEEFFIEVENNKKGVPGCIKWSHKADLNGYNNGQRAHTLNVKILNRTHGRNAIAQCIRTIANEESLSGKPTMELYQDLNNILSSIYPTMTDPDLVLYTGPLCCTHGLLPWHIRLSEFIQMSPDNSLSVYNYINAINKYNKCDQRFGK